MCLRLPRLLSRRVVPARRDAALAMFAWLLGLAAAACPMASSAAAADAPRDPLWREIWVGADATTQSWLLYSGTTIAPFGGIHEDGLRLRFAGGYGQYSWRGSSVTRQGERARGSGSTTFFDGLVGYLKRYGPLTTKAFAGVSSSGHRVEELFQPGGVPVAPGEEPISGREIGVKLALEFWLNLGPDAWSSLDLGWTSAHDTYSVRWRAGYRLWPTVSVGLEGIVNGDRRFDVTDLVEEPSLTHVNRRGGGFVRYEWFGGEVSLSGGVSAATDNRLTPYSNINWITQF